MKKKKKKESIVSKLSKKMKLKKVTITSKMTIKIKEREPSNIFHEESRFFKSELDKTRREMFFN